MRRAPTVPNGPNNSVTYSMNSSEIFGIRL
jgi:hypothetical protein